MGSCIRYNPQLISPHSIIMVSSIPLVLAALASLSTLTTAAPAAEPGSLLDGLFKQVMMMMRMMIDGDNDNLRNNSSMCLFLLI